MSRILSRRPSVATAIALVALFVALGGSSYAAIKIGSAQIANNSVKSVDLKNKGIAKKDLSPKAIAALAGQKGDQGEKGDKGDPGAPGTAVAYAYVNADGSVDESRSKGIADANVVANGGIYGFRGLGFEPKSVVTTMAFDSAAVTGNNASGGAAYIGDCNFVAGADQACVSTDDDGDPAAEARAYFVVFN